MRLFDLHCDTLYECYTRRLPLMKNGLHVDLTRGLKYDAWAQVFAVWMPDTLRGESAFGQCLAILEMARREAASHSEAMSVIESADDLDGALRARRCAAILSVEGGSALAGRLNALDTLAKLGVKVITLTWNGSNELGHGCLSGSSDGLTDFGKQALRRMEQIGIVPDVSHLNEQGFWDVMDCTCGPVIASHSVSAGVFTHPRNLTDEQFRAIAGRGGLVGLNLTEAQLGEQTFDCFRRHLDHNLSLGGERALALGCDMDGMALPKEWGGIGVMEKLYRYLQSKNYEESLLERLFFSNCYDFFRKILHRFDNG